MINQKLSFGVGMFIGACWLACQPVGPSQSPSQSSHNELPASAKTSAIESSEIQPSSSEALNPDEQSTEGVADANPSASPAPEAQPTQSAKVSPAKLPPPIFSQTNSSTCGKDPGIGTKAFDFTLPTPTGEELNLQNYRRRVVLLNFWGTWCKPCLKELPEFARLYRYYQKYGLTLIAIATDAEAQPVLEFIKKRKLMAKVVIQGEKLANQYDSSIFPFSFVLAQGNTIRASYRGYRPECLGQLEQDIRTQLQAL